MCSGGWGALRGTGPRTTGTEARFFVVRGPVPRNRALILAILIILAILLQTRERLRSSRTFSACSAEASIDIKVFQTFASSSWPS